MNIENAVVLVTGANRGLGRALVDVLLEAGAARVYAGARNTASLSGIRDARVVPVQLDVTSAADVAALSKLGDLTLVINNAGALTSYGLLTASREEMERDFAINFFGVLQVSKAVLPALEASKGALVNVLTVASLGGMAGLGGYSATKTAAFSLTQSLRTELRPRGIAVHAVFPGPIDTDMIKSFQLPKTSPREVAQSLVRGVARGEENIAPDPMSQQVFDAWLKDPRAAEKIFASM